jgi:cob(I)alamin adenosyltransferase
MGHRLTKIYTRTGDDGTTGLSDGTRVGKDSARVRAMGSIDETNSIIGMMLAEISGSDSVATVYVRIQHDLFDLGGELSIPGATLVTAPRVEWLEERTDELNEDLPPLKNFVLPGGNRAAAVCHLARTVCRRAERDLVTLGVNEKVNTPALQYLNRLSDLLFVTARVLARRDGGQEVLWQQQLKG